MHTMKFLVLLSFFFLPLSSYAGVTAYQIDDVNASFQPITASAGDIIYASAGATWNGVNCNDSAKYLWLLVGSGGSTTTLQTAYSRERDSYCSNAVSHAYNVTSDGVYTFSQETNGGSSYSLSLLHITSDSSGSSSPSTSVDLVPFYMFLAILVWFASFSSGFYIVRKVTD